VGQLKSELGRQFGMARHLIWLPDNKAERERNNHRGKLIRRRKELAKQLWGEYKHKKSHTNDSILTNLIYKFRHQQKGQRRMQFQNKSSSANCGRKSIAIRFS